MSVSVGDQSELGSSSSSDDRNAMQVESEWRQYIDRITPQARPRAIVDLITSTTKYYLQYGMQVADQWREEEQKRGERVPVEEIRQTIDKGAESQKNLLTAHRNMIRYAMQRIHEDQALSEGVMNSVQEYVSHFQLVYEEVFHPTEESDDRYKDRLSELKAVGEARSEELRTLLENLR